MSLGQRLESIEGEQQRLNLVKTYNYARLLSQDPVTNTGALIVSADFIKEITFGVNSFPSGVEVTDELLADKTWKYENIIHAEQAAIFTAAYLGKATKGAAIYAPWLSCAPCAKAIIASGIKTVIGHQQLIQQIPERWHESIGSALKMLEKAKVQVRMYNGTVGADPIMFNGAEYRP